MTGKERRDCGHVFGLGADRAGDVNDSDAVKKAYEMGRAIS